MDIVASLASKGVRSMYLSLTRPVHTELCFRVCAGFVTFTCFDFGLTFAMNLQIQTTDGGVSS